jgi:NHS family xanthosine MFS transporter
MSQKRLLKCELDGKIRLDAFKLFGTYKMALFFIFSMFLGGALQLTNMYGILLFLNFKIQNCMQL